MPERLPVEARHESMRGYFGYELHYQMQLNNDIWVVVGDLGYGLFDRIQADFPERFINCGAAEQAMMGIAVGLARSGKIPMVYSITPFLLYRSAETIRNYIDHEQIPVKLIGSGRDADYAHDGFSHDATDARALLTLFPNIMQYWPETKEDIAPIVADMLTNEAPSFVSLRR